jgi:hypothetical protein
MCVATVFIFCIAHVVFWVCLVGWVEIGGQGESLGDDELQAMIDEFDSSGTGEISDQDFLKISTSLRSRCACTRLCMYIHTHVSMKVYLYV